MRYIITLLMIATPALAKVPTVVTDIPPVHALVAGVMGDLGQPQLLLAKGADEHDFQLKPSQARAVDDADLVVWIGPELTPWLTSALDIRPGGAAALGLLDAAATHRIDHAEDTADGHAHTGADPHAWLDPTNAALWLGLIAAELARLDPENAATYAANAKAASDDIASLDATLTGLLAPARSKPLVTFHAAYSYFAAHYGLDFAGSIALGDAAAPGAAHLSELRDMLKSDKVTCIFPEAQHDPDLMLQIAEGTNAKIGGTLDPVGSTIDPGPDAYAALMKGIATTIADCVTG
jgi:zinc transport system substrate-binding protein